MIQSIVQCFSVSPSTLFHHCILHLIGTRYQLLIIQQTMIRTKTSKGLRITRNRKVGNRTCKTPRQHNFKKSKLSEIFLVDGCVLKLYRKIILESNVTSKPLYLVTFTTQYLCALKCESRQYENDNCFQLFFYLSNGIRKDMKFHTDF